MFFLATSKACLDKSIAIHSSMSKSPALSIEIGIIQDQVHKSIKEIFHSFLVFIIAFTKTSVSYLGIKTFSST
jgi:hypothetical protein